MGAPHVARTLKINGIVQGVGFRPFIYRLAHTHLLTGHVANTAQGVSILVEGPRNAVEGFIRDLPFGIPPLAHITEMTVDEAEPSRPDVFTIVTSRSSAVRATLISPDTAVCDDCLREMSNPHDRRYRYPFINCTNCGPRYTIIDDIPYDRPSTSMKHFPMCTRCSAEYHDPMDRRFHAQPNACHECGPQVALTDPHGDAVACDDAIGMVQALLAEGNVVAVKGLGGYHLAVDAASDEAVRRLRRRKRREEKPLAMMAPDLAMIRRFARVTEAEERLLTSSRRPIVLLEKDIKTGNETRNETGNETGLAIDIAPGNRCFGFMLPYTPLHYLLLEGLAAPLVMTSANLSEEPIAIDNGEALERLGGIADYFLHHNRDIYLRSDDSIVMRAAGDDRLLRRSRGYVPVPVFLRTKLPPILAVGGGLKNTICLTKGNQAFVSQHIGDLENRETLDFLELTDRHLRRILDVAPERVACDLHPDYLSTLYAASLAPLPVIPVQHHHAHIVSCMAEHRLEGRVIGLSFDGTGYGTDGRIWGGEVLNAGASGFERLAHLGYIPMPGSNAAIKEPWRMGLSYLHNAYGAAFREVDIPFVHRQDNDRGRMITAMIERGFNCPLTSSMGRLFDGVAAILGLQENAAYEGQAAIALEVAADGAAGNGAPYEAAWDAGAPATLATAPLIRAIVADLQQGASPSAVSRRFHRTVIHFSSTICEAVRENTGLDRVALSGGVFQNRILLEGLLKSLEEKGFRVYTHLHVPTNDGGLSLGQAVAAAAMAAGTE